MSKAPKVTGSPDRIWLVYGELEHDDTHQECYLHGEVTWCQDKQFDGDVEYVRSDKLNDFRALADSLAQVALYACELDDDELKHELADLALNLRAAARGATE